MVDFNPYREWLGVESNAAPASYYELLGLPPFEGDPDRILHAADQRINQIRRVRPGPNIDVWQKLLDELTEIRRLLTDAARKREYDDQLRRQKSLGGGLSQAVVAANPTAQDTNVHVSPVKNLLPPTAAEIANETAKEEAAAHGASGTPSPITPAAPINPAAYPPGMPPAGMPIAGMPTGGMQSSGAPGFGMPSSGMSGQGMPGQAIPGQSATPPGNPYAAAGYSYVPTGPQPTFSGPLMPPFAAPNAAGYGPAAPYAQPNYGQQPYGQPPYGAGGMGGPNMAAPGMPSMPNPGMPGAPMHGAPMPGGLMPNPAMGSGPQYGAPGQYGGGFGQAPPGGAFAGGMATPGYGQPQAPWGGGQAAPSNNPWPTPAPSPFANLGGAPGTAAPLPGATPARNAFDPMAPVASGFEEPAPSFSSIEPARSFSSGSSISSTALAASRRSSSPTLPIAAAAAVLITIVATVLVAMKMRANQELADAEAAAAAAALETEEPTPATPKPPVPPAGTAQNGATKNRTNKKPPAPTNGGANSGTSTSEKPADNVSPPNGQSQPPATPEKTPMPAAPTTPPGDMPAPTAPAPTTPPPTTPSPTTPPTTPATKPPVATAPPTASGGAAADMIKALLEAKAALKARKVDIAKKEIAAASGLAQTPDQKAMVSRLDLLSAYVAQFWDGVREGLKGVSPLDELVIGELRVAVVESSPTHLMIRAQGQNRRYEIDTLPAGVAEVLFERARDMKDPVNKMCKGAFHAVDEKRSPETARRIWAEAQLGGADVKELLAVLDDKYDLKAPAVMRTTAKRSHLPDPTALTEAGGAFRAKYGKEVAAAKMPQQKFDLAKKLLEEAQVAMDNEAIRYTILNEARNQAANAHFAQLTMEVVDETAKWFEIDVLATKAEALMKVAAGAAKPNSRDVALEALQLADMAVEAKRLDIADKLSKTASAAARKSGDGELVKRAADRAKELQQANRAAIEEKKAATKPGAKPDAKAKPDAAKPDAAKPDAAKPDATK